MKFFLISTLIVLAAGQSSAQECSVPGKLRCFPVASGSTPTLDGDLADWAAIDGIMTEIRSPYGMIYNGGEVSYKCQYDSEKVYFALDIPGEYRFDTQVSELCASIAVMFKMGSKAAFINMGGCPDAISGCDGGVPDFCEDYKVDIGAHWELSTTEQGVLYPMNTTTGTGDDPIASNDDEYAVSAVCRLDDDDAPAAGNEWEGAWTHSNPVDGAMGSYQFEIARLLTTASNVTDKQLAPGETYDFGIAFWDPFETEDAGWTDPGHYVTGCSSEWINLTLAIGADGGTPTDASASAGSFSFVGGLFMAFVCAAFW